MALATWAIPMVVISVMVLRNPAGRTVDPTYRFAVESWRECRSMYAGYGGFNYLPTFTSIYGPFVSLPQPWGQILWRWIASAGFAHALWMLLGSMVRPRLARGFLLLSLAAMPIALGALQTGQANSWLGVALLYAAVGLARSRAWFAACALAVGLSIKPLTIAAIGLAGTLRPSLVLPLFVTCIIALGLPFLLNEPSFVASQYRASFDNLRQSCLWVEENRFADLNGIFRALGAPIAPGASGWLRVASGAGIAILTAIVARRCKTHRDHEAAWMWWLAASAGYLMLFNPMTEANSYCIMSIPMALWGWRWLGAGEGLTSSTIPHRFSGRSARTLGWLTLAFLSLMGFASEALRPWLGNSLDLWFLPSVTIAFLLPVTVESLGLRPPSEMSDAERAEQPSP